MSVTFSECANSPSPRPPAWATRSVSVKPGVLTSQRSVLTGRDVVLEERARFRPPVPAGLHRPLQRPQPPVHLARAEPSELLTHGRGPSEPPPGPAQPGRQQGLEPGRPGIAGRLPDHPQRPDHLRPIGDGPRAPAPGRRPGRRPVQAPQGVLPVKAGHLAELVQDPALLLLRRRSVAVMNRLPVLPSGAPSTRSPSFGPRGRGRLPDKWRDDTLLSNLLHGAIRLLAWPVAPTLSWPCLRAPRPRRSVVQGEVPVPAIRTNHGRA